MIMAAIDEVKYMNMTINWISDGMWWYVQRDRVIERDDTKVKLPMLYHFTTLTFLLDSPTRSSFVSFLDCIGIGCTPINQGDGGARPNIDFSSISSTKSYSNPSIQIHIFLHIFLTICRIKTLSGDLESSHQALSIGTIGKAKYQSFVNVLN